MWKCGNVPPLSLFVNTGSVEMWRNVSSLSLPIITLEVCKTGNLDMCLVCFNFITPKVWKSGNVSGIIWELKIGLVCGEMTCVTSDCCQSQDSHIASFISQPGGIFLYLFVREENGRPWLLRVWLLRNTIGNQVSSRICFTKDFEALCTINFK